MKRHIVMLGAPGSGKGTQAHFIAKRFGLAWLSPGAIFREEMAKGSELGKAVEREMNKGGLLPDFMIMDLVESRLKESSGGFVFDGFPRTMVQAEELRSLLARHFANLDIVIYLDVPEETIRERILHRRICSKCGAIVSQKIHLSGDGQECPDCGGALRMRPDDREEVLSERLGEYRAKTAPLAGWYDALGVLRRVNGNRRPEEVSADIEQLLK